MPDKFVSSIPGPARPVDLELRISTPWGLGGGRSLEFMLSSPSGVAGFHYESIPGKPIDHPERYKQQLLEQLAALRRGRDVDGNPVLRREMLRELELIGRDLYLQLFPRELRRICCDLRGSVKTLLVTSDEPWIPWELLYPSDGAADDFFCMHFQMSRWLSGEVSPASSRRVGRLVYLDASGPEDLAAAEHERRFLEALVKQTEGLDGCFQSGATAKDFIDHAEAGDFELLHYVGHGEHDRNLPGEAKLLMADRRLRARHISPRAADVLRERRPLVFFNTCQLGQIDRSLVDLDGWAPRFVRQCGCSAFLAPLWAVRDQRAARFAEVFYAELQEGRTLGEAVLLARHKVRAEDPAEMSWLAYTLYGHPNAQIFFGGQGPVLASAHESTSPPIILPPKPSLSALDHGRARGSAQSAVGRMSQDPKRLLVSSLGLLVLAVVAVVIWTAMSGRARLDGPEPVDVASDSLATRGPATPANSADSDGASPPLPTKRAPAYPVMTVVRGKLAVVAIDRSTGSASRDVAEAIESILIDRSSAEPFVPQIEDKTVLAAWAAGDLSLLPKGGSPWGAATLLLASVTIDPIDQSNSNLSGVRMTLGTRWVDLANRTTLSRSGFSTHTGMGATRSTALAQAAERCLGELPSQIQGE